MRAIVDVLRFIVGFADMSDRFFQFDNEDVERIPRGYFGALLLLTPVFALLLHNKWLSLEAVGTGMGEDLVAGFLLAMFYTMIMNLVNQTTYYGLRGKN